MENFPQNNELEQPAIPPENGRGKIEEKKPYGVIIPPETNKDQPNPLTEGVWYMTQKERVKAEARFNRESKKIIELAKKTSGKIALGVKIFGMGLLALGMSARSAHGIEVKAKRAGKIKIENILPNEEGREMLKFLPIEKIPSHSLKNPEAKPTVETSGGYDIEFVSDTSNNFFDTLTRSDYRGVGVEYSLENENNFNQKVLDDANRIVKELFDIELKDISPKQFVKLINAMVQENMEYDYLSIENSEEGVARDEEISLTAIDQMYLHTHKGVCRHYAALVEAVGESLQKAGAVPNCEGIRIDEVDSNDLMHAWNIYYMNLDRSGKKVVVSFTDATWDDDGKFGDGLEGRIDHPSVAESIFSKKNEFGYENTITVMNELDQLNLGQVEGLAIKRILAMHEDREIIENAINILKENDADVDLLLLYYRLEVPKTIPAQQTEIVKKINETNKIHIQTSFDRWQDYMELSISNLDNIDPQFFYRYDVSWSRLIRLAKNEGDSEKIIDASNKMFDISSRIGMHKDMMDSTKILVEACQQKGLTPMAKYYYERALAIMPEGPEKDELNIDYIKFNIRHDQTSN